jgi:PIN domain nuclease of toxin-antitoxin system
VNVLLDTSATIWLTDNKKAHSIGKEARRLMEKAEIVYVSSISIAEVRIKIMLGKLKLVPELVKVLEASGLVMLDFKPEHANVIQSFQRLVRHDPFDRMLLAQASSENLVFLTGDQALLELNLPYVIDVGE